MGRKSAYTDQLADEIIADLSKGVPLLEICRREHMPEAQSVYRWCEANPDFAGRFVRARAEGYDAIAQDCVRIADDASRDIIDDGRGGLMQNNVGAARARLQIETRLKLLAKWDPKRYGDRLAIEAEVNTKTLSRADALAALQSGTIDVGGLLQRWTKPVEAIEAEAEAKTDETAQPAQPDDFIDIPD
jgi:ABC-type nitrate/sulfonate/bicarbonate transport system substrate-binding protein